MKSAGAVALLSLVALAEACGDYSPEHHRRHKLYGRQAASPTTHSLKATNPTAVPLSSISLSMSSPVPAPTSAAAGAKATGIPNAPALPKERIDPKNYPEFDQIPPIDSPQVKQWIAEVQAAGITIPTFGPTNLNGCANNTEAAADKSRCWWTCGGCVTADDITECDTKDHWAMTYDDGPGLYTANLLTYLDEVKVKTTFFVVGSRVKQYPETLQAQHVAGHQIAIHTWSHKALTTLSNEEIIAELGWTKKIIRDVLGVTPTHMRPPFGDIDNRVRAISHAMGLTPVMWTRFTDSTTGPDGIAFNTQDFDVRLGKTAFDVVKQWETLMATVPRLTKGFITLQHDIYQEFVELATGYIIPDALARTPKLTIEPVITCVNMPLANAYIETNDNKTNPFKAKLPAGSPGAAVSLASGSLGALALGAAISLMVAIL